MFLKKNLKGISGITEAIALNVPRITISGNREMLIENFKALAEFEACRLRVNTKLGALKISGDNLIIREINQDCIVVSGGIHSVDFEAGGK